MQQDITLVHAACDQVPCDAVLRLACQFGPDGGVQAGIAGQGAIVEIDCTLCRQIQQIGGQHVQIGDAEQPVERQSRQTLRQIRPRSLDTQARIHGPSGDIGAARDDGGQIMTRIQQHLTAVLCQGFMADQHGGKRAHHDLPFISRRGIGVSPLFGVPEARVRRWWPSNLPSWPGLALRLAGRRKSCTPAPKICARLHSPA